MTQFPPCPFCTSPTPVMQKRLMPFFRTYFQLVCRQCGAAGPIKEEKYQAIDAWCDRSSPPTTPPGHKLVPIDKPTVEMGVAFTEACGDPFNSYDFDCGYRAMIATAPAVDWVDTNLNRNT